MQRFPKVLLLLLTTGLLAVTACKKDKDDDPETPTVELGEVSFKVDGDTKSYSDGNGTFSYSSDDTTTYASAWFDPTNLDHYFISVGIAKFDPVDNPLTPQQAWEAFAPGSKSFARETSNPFGAMIEWRGPNDVYFLSTRGEQSGSTFTITERAEYPGDFALGFEVAGTFSAKVYDEQGNVKTITNGSWRGYVPLY